MAYDAVLFDNDGVVIQRTDPDVMRRGVHNAFQATGVSQPKQEDVTAIRNFSALTVAQVCEICHCYGLDPESFWASRENEVCAVQRDEMRNGNKTLFEDFTALDTLEASGVTLGIVSNNQHNTVRFMIDHFGLEGTFETFYGVDPTFDGIRRRKPDPYYVYQALSDINSTDVLFVGDKETDVRAARLAGLDTVYLRRDESRSDAETFESKPDFQIASLSELPGIVTGDGPTKAREFKRY